MSCRSGRVERVLLVLTGALVGALGACSLPAPAEERVELIQEVTTKYYLLMGQFQFAPTDFGATPQVRSFGGGPWWVPLEECEITPEAAPWHSGAYVTLLHQNGRLEEVGLWYGGVICRRFSFRYDADGRLAGRIDTLYESRQEGEYEGDWVARMKGKTPAVGCVRELAYSWSADGRTVDVKLVKSEGEEPRVGNPDWPRIIYGQLGQVLGTWKVDANVRVVEASRYSATYDNSGRLLTEETEGDKTEHTYDAQGRLVKTAVQREIRDTMVFVHGYPHAGPPALSATERKSDQRFVVSHDKSGHVVQVKVAGEEVSPVGNFALTFQRDEQGRVKSMRMKCGFFGIFSVPMFPAPAPQ